VGIDHHSVHDDIPFGHFFEPLAGTVELARTNKGRDYDAVEGVVRGVVGFDGVGVDGEGNEDWEVKFGASSKERGDGFGEI